MADNTSVAQWFGLNHPNFILDPIKDASFYAPRSKINIPAIVEGLQVNLVTERPPKRFFWGVYGGGKTHTILHISNQLQSILDIYPVYIECPSVPRKSTFLNLYHDGIMASLGQDYVVELFKNLIDSMGTVRFEELFSEVKNLLGDEELSRAVTSLLGARSEKELAFWRYISGVSVSQRDLAELNQTQALVDSTPSRLATVLIIIGKVVKKIYNKTLTLIIDEIDRLKVISDEYGISTYEEAFRRLVDDNQKDVAILMSCSAVNFRELPEIFGGGEFGPILSRIGTQNLLEIPEISPEDVDVFINAIIRHTVSKEVAEQRVEELKTQIDEELKVDLYPFTTEAIEALKGTLRGIMTPREITQRMTDAAGTAYLMKKRAISSDIIT